MNRTSRSTLRASVVLWCAIGISGCASDGAGRSTTRNDANEDAVGIRLPDFDAAPKREARLGRSFQCVVTGHGTAPVDGSAIEQRRAGTQAAIVDALFQALAGPVSSDTTEHEILTVALSPRLSLQSTPDGRRIVLQFDDRGRTHRIEVVNGRLAHRPIRTALVTRFLAEIKNDVRLVSTEPTTEPGRWAAIVACYEQRAPATRPSPATQPTAVSQPTTQSAA